MASAFGRLAKFSAFQNIRMTTFAAVKFWGTTTPPFRTAVCTETGGIQPKPKKTSFGLLRIAMVVVPFLYVGTLISKNFAALLEEHDIFVPEDDDDDD